jgi:hypothetical protein
MNFYGLAVIMGAGAYDVDLSHSGRKIGAKPAESTAWTWPRVMERGKIISEAAYGDYQECKEFGLFLAPLRKKLN